MLDGWNLLIGGASSVECLRSRGLLRLVCKKLHFIYLCLDFHIISSLLQLEVSLGLGDLCVVQQPAERQGSQPRFTAKVHSQGLQPKEKDNTGIAHLEAILSSSAIASLIWASLLASASPTQAGANRAGWHKYPHYSLLHYNLPILASLFTSAVLAMPRAWE